MVTGQWSYHVVSKDEGTPAPISLIAVWVAAREPLRAAMWSPPREAWVSAPEIAARRLYDDQYQGTTQPVDRATAERVARNLGTELPSEEELREIFVEGERLNQPWGPMTPP
jgi:hypothetical protein